MEKGIDLHFDERMGAYSRKARYLCGRTLYLLYVDRGECWFRCVGRTES